MSRRVTAAWVLFACTIALAIVWVAGVGAGFAEGTLQFLLPALGAAAAATLLASALFNPVRRKLQPIVDRRFDRVRYDSRPVLDDLAASMCDRVDPESVREEWVGAVLGTIQPTSVAVWVREQL